MKPRKSTDSKDRKRSSWLRSPILWFLLVSILVHHALIVSVVRVPALERYEADAASRFELATLASAITLTPGTVTVDADGGTLLVHSLTAGSRASLREGRLRRTVAFVFRGRGAGGELRLAGRKERDRP